MPKRIKEAAESISCFSLPSVLIVYGMTEEDERDNHEEIRPRAYAHNAILAACPG